MHTKTPSPLHETIRKLRKDKGLTQENLGSIVGLSRNYINLIESGKKIPSIDALTKIAEKLDTTPGKIMSGEDAVRNIISTISEEEIIQNIDEIRSIIDRWEKKS